MDAVSLGNLRVPLRPRADLGGAAFTIGRPARDVREDNFSVHGNGFGLAVADGDFSHNGEALIPTLLTAEIDFFGREHDGGRDV